MLLPVKYGLFLPSACNTIEGYGSSTSSQSLDGASHGVGVTLQLPTDEQITHIGFLRTDADGTDATVNYHVGFQGTDSEGEPDGTWLTADGGGDAKADYPKPADSFTDTWEWVDLGSQAYTGSIGDHVAMICEHDSGSTTPSPSVDVSIAYSMSVGSTSADSGGWTACLNSGSAWVTTFDFDLFPWAFRTSSGNTYWGRPATDTGALNGNVEADDADDAIGWKFKVPVACKLYGARFMFDANGGGPYQITVRNVTDATQLAREAPWDQISSGERLGHFLLTSPISLSTGKEYFVGMGPSTGTSNMCYGYGLTLPDSTDSYKAYPLAKFADDTSTGFTSVWDNSAGTYSDKKGYQLFGGLFLGEFSGGGGGGGNAARSRIWTPGVAI